MRNAKLWSVLLVAVLLCACIVGVLFTGASAGGEVTYGVNYTEGIDEDKQVDEIQDVFDAVEAEIAAGTWIEGNTLVIKFSGTIEAKVEGSELVFGQKTIFTSTGKKLPIEIVGQSEGKTDKITVDAKVACANDYTFKNLTLDNWTGDKALFAGSANIVLDSLAEKTSKSGRVYGDNFTAEAFSGWTKADFEALKDEDGCILTSATFKDYAYAGNVSNSSDTFDSFSGIAAVGAEYNTAEGKDAYTATASDDASYTITPADTKAKVHVMSGACTTRVSAYVAQNPARVHTAYVRVTGGSVGCISGDEGGGTIANNIVNGNIDIYVKDATFTSTGVGIRVFYGDTNKRPMTNTADAPAGEYGNVTVFAQNVKLCACVFIAGDNNTIIPGKATVYIDKVDHQGKTKVSEMSDFEYLGILAENGVENTVKNCHVAAFSGVRLTATSGVKLAYITNTLDNVYFKNSTTSDLKTNNVKTGKRTGTAFLYNGTGMRESQTVTITVGNVTNNLNNCVFNHSYSDETLSTGEVSAAKYPEVRGAYGLVSTGTLENNVTNCTFELNVFKGLVSKSGLSTNVAKVKNNFSGNTFKKEVYATDSSKVTSITNTIENGTFSGVFYGSVGGTIQNVTNKVNGGTFSSNYYGTSNSTITGTVLNHFNGGTFSKELRMTNGGTIAQIENVFDGATLKATTNGTYKSKFTKLTNTLKSGNFAGAFYGCYVANTDEVGDVVNYIQGGTYTAKNYIFGGYGGKSIKSVTNEVTGNPQFTFKPSDVGSGQKYYVYDGVCFGSGSRLWPSKVLGNVITSIKGGTFAGNVLGAGQSGYVVGDIETTIEAGSFYQYYGAGYNGCNTTKPTESGKDYLESDWGKLCGGTVKNIFGKAGASTGATFSSYVMGADSGNADNVATVAYDVENVVNYATFNGNFYGGADSSKSNVASITNTINGGIFAKRYIGGSYSGVVGSVKNVIHAGAFNGAANADYFTAYLGCVQAKVTGGIVNEIDGGSFAAYVIAGSAGGAIANPDGPAVENIISGGTFHNFWGGCSKDNKITGNIVNTISGGTFDSLNDGGQTYPNCFNGGNRNGAHAGGNIINTISGGTFKTNFTAGNNAHQASMSLTDVAPAYAVTTNITGGIFEGNVYANSNPKTIAENSFIFATATLTITQTEGKELAFYATVEECDSFTANGEAIKIGKNTEIVAAVADGTVSVLQTEGWLVRDYVTLCSGSASFGEITTAEGAFGDYKVDSEGEEKILCGAGANARAATLILDKRLNVRVLFDPEVLEEYGSDFTFAAKLGGAALATEYAEYTADGVTYASYLIKGIGLGEFTDLIEISGAALNPMSFSVVSLADQGAQHYEKRDAVSARLFESIANLGRKENGEESGYYDLVTKTVDWTPTEDQKPKALDPRLDMKTVGLVMTDAIGLRFTGIADPADLGLKFVVNGTDVTSACVVKAGENGAFTVDMYVNVTMMTGNLNLAITDAEDAALFTMTVRVDALAQQIAASTEADAELIDYALAYVQAADAYVKAKA